MHARFARAAGLLLASCLAACSGEDEPPPPSGCWPGPDDGAPLGEAELGAGEVAFEALAPDQEVVLIHGPQGGYHVNVWPRVRGMVVADDGSIDTLFSAYVEEGDEVDLFECPHNAAYVADPAGGDYLMTRSNIPLIVLNERVPDIDGHSLLLRVEMVDAEGRYARDERRVVPHLSDDPADPDAGPLGNLRGDL